MIELIGIAKRSAPRAPMKELDSVEISIENGIADDIQRNPSKRQVTILSRESWKQACEEIGIDALWITRRANLLIKGFEFSSLDLGKTVRIGEVTLKITGETEPCYRMDEQYEGLTSALKPNFRSGVFCQVVKGGLVSVGDKVEIF